MAIISSILVKRIEARMKCLWVEKRVLGSSRDQRDSIASNRNVWIQGYQKRPFHAPFEPAVYEAFQRLLHVALSFFENIRVLSTHCFPSSLFSSRCFSQSRENFCLFDTRFSQKIVRCVKPRCFFLRRSSRLKIHSLHNTKFI